MVSRGWQPIFRLISVTLILLIWIIEVPTIKAQQPGQWTPEQRIPDYLDDTLPPLMVADQNRTVHSFASQWVGENNDQLAVVYCTWTKEDGWTAPVDIMLSPISQARVYGAFLDQNSIMHLMFFGGDDRGADIYYAQAPAALAGRAQAWSKPELVGKSAITPSTAALVGDNNGNLVIVYSGNIDGNGVYLVQSTDSGYTWSDSMPVAFTYSDELWPSDIRLTMGSNGQLHTVWNVVDTSGHSVAGYYARLNVDKSLWNDPIELAEGIGIQEGMGMHHLLAIEHNNSIVAIYNNGIPPTGVPPAEWVRRSDDGGKTWTPVARVFPQHVGRSGIASFVVDSNNNLRVLFGERVQLEINGVYAENSGIWHSRLLDGDNWSAPDPVVTTIRMMGGSEIDPETQSIGAYDARAVISQGNVILVTWRSDPGFARNGVWYSYTTLPDTPELPLQPLPTVAPTATPTPELEGTSPALSLTPVPTTSPTPFFTDSAKEIPADSFMRNPGAAIVVGIVPVILILAITFGFYRWFHYRHS